MHFLTHLSADRVMSPVEGNSCSECFVTCYFFRFSVYVNCFAEKFSICSSFKTKTFEK